MKGKKRNNKRRGIMYNQPKVISGVTQTFGPGSTVCRVTNYVHFVPTDDQMTHGTIELMKLMAQTSEFESYVTRFKYYKIIGVKIIIQPRLTYELTPLLQSRITIDWTNNTNENILADDGSKEVNYYNTRPKVYRFRPPKMTINRYGNAYNLGGWTPTNIDLNYLPGWLKISSEFPLNLCTETIVIFRGNQTSVNPQSQIIKFEGGKVVEVQDEKEEEEKKEREEEEEEEEKENINIEEERRIMENEVKKKKEIKKLIEQGGNRKYEPEKKIRNMIKEIF